MTQSCREGARRVLSRFGPVYGVSLHGEIVVNVGKVIGSLWATRKHHSLDGIKLCVIQPLDHRRKPRGQPLIATDIMNQVGLGEIVFYVEGGDATRLMPGPRRPFDAAVVGIIDSLSTDKAAPTGEYP